MGIEIDYEEWEHTFAILPKLTISKRITWGRCYRRIVWVNSGFCDEPEYQYGELFDVLKWS